MGVINAASNFSSINVERLPVMEPDRWADINSPHLQAISCRHQCPESPLWEHALWGYCIWVRYHSSEKPENFYGKKCPLYKVSRLRWVAPLPTTAWELIRRLIAKVVSRRLNACLIRISVPPAPNSLKGAPIPPPSQLEVN